VCIKLGTVQSLSVIQLAGGVAPDAVASRPYRMSSFDRADVLLREVELRWHLPRVTSARLRLRARGGHRTPHRPCVQTGSSAPSTRLPGWNAPTPTSPNPPHGSLDTDPSGDMAGTRWGHAGDMNRRKWSERRGRGDRFRSRLLLFSQVARTAQFWGSRGRRFESGQPDQHWSGLLRCRRRRSEAL